MRTIRILATMLILLGAFAIGQAKRPTGGIIQPTALTFTINDTPASYVYNGAERTVGATVSLSAAISPTPNIDAPPHDFSVSLSGSGNITPSSLTFSFTATSLSSTPQNVTVTILASVGVKTYTATCAGLTPATATARVVEMASLEYKIGTGIYSAVTNPMYVAKGSTVTFKAIPNPTGTLPAGKATWTGSTGTSGATGNGETKDVTFNTAGSCTVTAECGNTVTANIHVIQVIFAPNPATVVMGGTTAITPTVTPAGDVGQVTYDTENSAIATYNGTTVTGVAGGTTNVQAKVGGVVCGIGAVTCYTISLKVRPKKSDGSGDFSDVAYICAGGISSNAHIAEIKVTTTPAVTNVTIAVSLTGGSGINNTPALLTMNSTTTNNEGIITGILRSSNRVENATLSAGGIAVTVCFDSNIAWYWVPDCEYITTDNTQHITMLHHGEPVNGHELEFHVNYIEYCTFVDDELSVVPSDDQGVIEDLTTFDPVSYTTDADGKVDAELTANDSLLVYMEMSAEDVSVYDSAYSGGLYNGPHPGEEKTLNNPEKPIAEINDAHDVVIGGVAIGKMCIIPINATSANPIVAPGQIVTMSIKLNDNDRIRYQGEPNNGLTVRPVPPNWGTYNVKVTILQNAEIYNANNNGQNPILESTIPAQRQQGSSQSDVVFEI